MRALLFVVMMLGTTPALAEWIQYNSSDDGRVDAYIDPAAIRRDGDLARVWELRNWKEPAPFPNLTADNPWQEFVQIGSQKVLDIYDCRDKRHARLAITAYSGQMGHGDVVDSYTWTDLKTWNAVASGSWEETVLQIACSRRPSATAGAAREWTKLYSRDSNGDYDHYIDLSTILRDSDRQVRAWFLVDYRGVQTLGRDHYRSFVEQRTFDCQGERNRQLTGVYYSGQMQMGSVIYSGSDPLDWQSVIPGSFGEDVLRFICPSGAESSAQSSPRPNVAQGAMYGTGFFISSSGYALTNNHVVESCGAVHANLPDGNMVAEVLRRDTQNDLALIRVRTNGAVAYARFRSAPAIRAGESVVVAGFPLPGLLENGLNVTLGNVSALAGMQGNASQFQITAPVQPGNSGGPLLDMSGNLVGVVVSKLDASLVAEVTGDIPQNINFAVKGAIARLFLDSSEQQIAERPSTTELRIGDVTDKARTFTFQIECRL